MNCNNEFIDNCCCQCQCGNSANTRSSCGGCGTILIIALACILLSCFCCN